jgi:hypothetical protein
MNKTGDHFAGPIGRLPAKNTSWPQTIGLSSAKTNILAASSAGGK